MLVFITVAQMATLRLIVQFRALQKDGILIELHAPRLLAVAVPVAVPVVPPLLHPVTVV